MTYVLYIKSHCDLPDIDHEIEAKNKHEATIKLLKIYSKYGFTKSQIRKSIIKL